MSNTTINYTNDEYRAAQAWCLQKTDVSIEMILTQNASLTDDFINQQTRDFPDFRDNAQSIVNQYREAKRRNTH